MPDELDLVEIRRRTRAQSINESLERSSAGVILCLEFAKLRLSTAQGEPTMSRCVVRCLRPGCHDAQAGDAVEVVAVARCHAETVGEGGRGDPEVVRADRLTSVGEVRPDVGVNARDGLRDGDRLEAGEDAFDERPSPRPDRSLGAIDSVQQLADGDHADRAVFVAQQLLDFRCRVAALEVDEQKLPTGVTTACSGLACSVGTSPGLVGCVGGGGVA